MSQKRFFRIKNFDEMQHYKDRNPIWIKLYCSLLDDYEFAQIADETKFHAVGLMILAGRLNNKLPDDERWLRQKINANAEINLKSLLEIGFLSVVKNSRNRNKNDLTDILDNDKESFNARKSNKTQDEFASTTSKTVLAQNRTEQMKTEENTAQQNRRAAPNAENAEAVPCADSENLFKTEAENRDGNNLIKGNFSGKPDGDGNGSQFTIEECLRYVEICLSQGENIKNAKGLANHLYQTGNSDAFIRAALFPERQSEIERERFGAPVKFTDQPCRVCFGAKMADADGKGFRQCVHCKNERGKPTGFEPEGETGDE